MHFAALCFGLVLAEGSPAIWPRERGLALAFAVLADAAVRAKVGARLCVHCVGCSLLIVSVCLLLFVGAVAWGAQRRVRMGSVGSMWQKRACVKGG